MDPFLVDEATRLAQEAIDENGNKLDHPYRVKFRNGSFLVSSAGKTCWKGKAYASGALNQYLKRVITRQAIKQKVILFPDRTYNKHAPSKELVKEVKDRLLQNGDVEIVRI